MAKQLNNYASNVPHNTPLWKQIMEKMLCKTTRMAKQLNKYASNVSHNTTLWKQNMEKMLCRGQTC